MIDHLQEVEADGHKLNVREFEEVTQEHVKEFEDMRLRINFKSRASHVLPLCVDRCVWTVCVDCRRVLVFRIERAQVVVYSAKREHAL